MGAVDVRLPDDAWEPADDADAPMPGRPCGRCRCRAFWRPAEGETWRCWPCHPPAEAGPGFAALVLPRTACEETAAGPKAGREDP